MSNPTMILEQAGAPFVSRSLRQPFGRLAANFPDHGTVELSVNSLGHFSVQVGPAPGHGGEFVKVFDGTVRDGKYQPLGTN